MFDDDMFEAWLNKKAGAVFDKVGREEPIRPDEMMILVLKAQANHFMHLDTDLRKDMRDLREDMNRDVQDLRKDMKDLREDMNTDIKDLREDMKNLREDMDKRFNRTQWLIGLGIALLVALMSLNRFFQ